MNDFRRIGKENACESGKHSPIDFCESRTSAETETQITTSKFGWGGPRNNSGGPRANSGGPRANSGGPRPGAGRPRKPIPEPIVRFSLGPRWYCFQTFPQAERLATRDLADKGYRAEMPMQAIQRRDKVVRTMLHTVHVPMFSQYGFVELDVDCDPWIPVTEADGVRKLFMTASMRPIPLPVGFVERLIETAPERLKLPAVAMDKIAPGTVVRIDEGPMTSFTAICRKCDGITSLVTVDLFGRQVQVAMARAALSRRVDGGESGAAYDGSRFHSSART